MMHNVQHAEIHHCASSHAATNLRNTAAPVRRTAP